MGGLDVDGVDNLDVDGPPEPEGLIREGGGEWFGVGKWWGFANRRQLKRGIRMVLPPVPQACQRSRARC